MAKYKITVKCTATFDFDTDDHDAFLPSEGQDDHPFNPNNPDDVKTYILEDLIPNDGIFELDSDPDVDSVEVKAQ
jgi:hypothetical protein